jgi:hypothetical protein
MPIAEEILKIKKEEKKILLNGPYEEIESESDNDQKVNNEDK